MSLDIRLAHLRIALAVLVLGRARGIDDGGVHDRPPAHLQAVLLQVVLDQYEQLLAQVVGLQQVTELADRGLVRDRFPAEVDADEAAHRPGVVQGFLDRRVGQVEPVLQEVDAQHPLDTNRPAAGTLGLGVERLHHAGQVGPRNDPVHVIEELLAAGLLAMLLEAFFRKGLLAHGRSPLRCQLMSVIIADAMD